MPQDNPWITYRDDTWDTQHGWQFQVYHNPPKTGSDEPIIADVDVTPVMFARAMTEVLYEDMRWSGHDDSDFALWLCDKYGVWHALYPGRRSQTSHNPIVMEFMAETYSYICQSLPKEYREVFVENRNKWNGQTWNGKIWAGLATLPQSDLLDEMPEEKDKNFAFLRDDGSLYTLDSEEELDIRLPGGTEINQETRGIIRSYYFPSSMPRLPKFEEPADEQDASDAQATLSWLMDFYPDDLFYMVSQMLIQPHKTMGLYIKETADGGKTTFRDMVRHAFGGYAEIARAAETVSLGESSKYDNAKLKYSGGRKIVQVDEVDKTGISGKLYTLTEEALADLNPKYGVQMDRVRTANTIMYAGGPPPLDPSIQGIQTRIQFVVWDKSETTMDSKERQSIIGNPVVLGLVQKMFLDRAREIMLQDLEGEPTEQMAADSSQLFAVNASPIEPALLEAIEEHPDGFVANSEIKEILEDLPAPSKMALPKIIKALFPNSRKGQSTKAGKPRGYFGVRLIEHESTDAGEIGEPDPTKQHAMDGTGVEH